MGMAVMTISIRGSSVVEGQVATIQHEALASDASTSADPLSSFSTTLSAFARL
jgi:hypothetical protein